MLASDPNNKTSAAALDIKIGSFHDPVHLQGLAHLCEHVLFTGSELFPNESYSGPLKIAVYTNTNISKWKEKKIWSIVFTMSPSIPNTS